MSRESDIDALKFIGLIGLIASHTFTNDIILQVRSFDVNLLVIISEYLAERNQTNKKISYSAYCKKRIKRLLFPTWIFITVYFIINVLFKFQKYSIVQIVRSYLLLNNSIGYVWIIYVYLICAITMPFLEKIETKNYYTKGIVIAGMVGYLYLAKVSDNYWYQLIVLYPIIYSLISIIGIFIARNENKFCENIMVCGFLIFVEYVIALYKINGKFIVTGEYKYPPQLYYLSYSIGMSILLFKFKSKLLGIVEKLKMMNIVLFFSKHSLWLYLWHILALQVATKFRIKSVLLFVSVLIMSVLLTYAQDKIVNKLENRGISDNILSLFRG